MPERLAEIKALYDEKVDEKIPRFGSFDRAFVGDLLAEIDRLEKRLAAACRVEAGDKVEFDFAILDRLDSIREAIAEEREACAKIAEALAKNHAERCPPQCRCDNGYHVAAAIRKSPPWCITSREDER